MNDELLTRKLSDDTGRFDSFISGKLYSIGVSHVESWPPLCTVAPINTMSNTVPIAQKYNISTPLHAMTLLILRIPLSFAGK